MVFGVTFRAAAYMVLGAFVMAMLDTPMRYLLSFANHSDHYLISSIDILITTVIPIILVISAGIMIVGNAIVRKSGVR